MSQAEGLVFGKSPRRDLAIGAISIVIGISFAGLILFFLIVEPEMIEPGPQNYIAIVFLAIIALSGVLYVVHRGKFLVILTEHSVWVGPSYMKEEIEYCDIMGVRRGVDGEVILDRENCWFSYTITCLFNSDGERNRFVEELERRVSEARAPRTPNG